MRIGAFLIGGLVGATAAVMLSRSNNKWMMAGLSSAGESMGKMWNQKKWFAGEHGSRKWSSSEDRHTSNWDRASGGKNDSATTSASKESLSEIKDIVDKDPELKQHVSQILSENESPKFANH